METEGTDEKNTGNYGDNASDEDSTNNDCTEEKSTDNDSTGCNSSTLITYSEAFRTPERPRKGKITTYEYGGRSDSGMGTRKKSNITKRYSDSQHQTEVIALDNSENDSEESDDGSNQYQENNTNIPAKGLRGDGET